MTTNDPTGTSAVDRKIPRSAAGRTRSGFHRRLAMAAVGLSLALLMHPAMGYADGYAAVVIALIATTSCIVLTMTVLAGSSGIWSLAHASFVALGSYLSANFAALGLPMELSLLASFIIAALIGYFLGLTAGRFSTIYFGLMTLAVSLAASELIQSWRSVTGGDLGMVVPPMPSLIYMADLKYSYGASVSILVATILFVAVDFVIRGVHGRRWRAIKSQRIASMSIGLVPHRENAAAFAFSAGLAAMAGVPVAVTIGYLDPMDYSLERGVILLAGTVVGGIGSIAGALFGGLFIAGVPEAARDLRDVATFVFGTTMILVLIFLPQGVVPSLADLYRRGVRRLSVGKESAERQKVDPQRVEMLVRDLMPASREALSMKDLSVSFGGLKAIQHVSLFVAPGQTLGLIGPNGAGKTTLLNVLSGYVKPSACQELKLGNHDLLRLAPHARLAAGFGRTFQHAELFDEVTMRETLEISAASRSSTSAPDAGSPEVIAQRIIDGLGLHDYADVFPSQLPFGIQKEIDIARMLAAGPHLVALDEPFSGLDHQEVDQLRSILYAMRKAGVSIIIIDHAVQEVLNIADDILVLDFGEILATGKPETIRTNPAVLEAYFGKAAKADQKVR